MGRRNMRWFVEISSIGVKPGPTTTLCVEATQWQPALQQARALRGEDGVLSNFSIELLEEGARAIDPSARMRYVVHRAPDDAVLSTEGDASTAVAPAPEEAQKKRGLAQTIGFASMGTAVVQEAMAAAGIDPPKKRSMATTMGYGSSGSVSVNEPASAAEAAGRSPSLSLPSFDLLSKREDNPSERSPLSYREFVYAVPTGTTEDEAHQLILERFDTVRKSLEQARAGKLINLAIFDHRFQTRPLRRPLATLTWKDWTNDAPEVLFPLRGMRGAGAPGGSGPAASPQPSLGASGTGGTAATGSSASSAGAAPAPSAAAQPAPRAVEATAAAKPAPAPAVSAAPAPVATPDRISAPAPLTPPPPIPSLTRPGRRLAGDDLIAEIFEAFNDLHFLRDPLEGAEFVLSLTLEKVPSEVGVISFFDINRREFVIVRQMGGVHSALCERQPDKATIASTAMRKKTAVVISDLGGIASALDDRWGIIGVEIRSLVCAPVEQGGRYLGLIELANPLDGGVFSEGDGNALTYIGQQFAEFTAARGVVIDPELILQKNQPTSGKKKGR